MGGRELLPQDLQQRAGITETNGKFPGPVGLLLSEVEAEQVKWLWRGAYPKASSL